MYSFNPLWSCSWDPVHQVVDELLTMMFKKINRGNQSLTSSTSSSNASSKIALLVEHVMAELEVVVDKLKKLPLVIEVLSKCRKQLQLEFLDHGVLSLLKNWLEPLPDGSLPNINIRAAILKILTDFPIDLEQYVRREQLKKSGLRKANE